MSHFDLGLITLKERDPRKALKHFDLAESQGYDANACAAQRWFCWMLLGDFNSAWKESEALAALGSEGAECLWNGRPLTGKRVVIRCLHGLGDAIQFIRYAPLLRAQAARLTVESSGELLSFFNRQGFIDQAISWSDGSSTGFDGWDAQIEVMELPRYFQTTLDTIPSREPYLEVDKSAIERFGHLLGKSSDPSVGLVWRASDWNPLRSIPPDALQPILDVPGISFYNFQYGDGRLVPIRDAVIHCADIADTAAALMNMDLLITVDTMAAHLAGALGIPVWTLLHSQSDWRWMMGRTDSPWYPTMRLFRQTEPGESQPSITAAADELRKRFNR